MECVAEGRRGGSTGAADGPKQSSFSGKPLQRGMSNLEELSLRGVSERVLELSREEVERSTDREGLSSAVAMASTLRGLENNSGLPSLLW